MVIPWLEVGVQTVVRSEEVAEFPASAWTHDPSSRLLVGVVSGPWEFAGFFSAGPVWPTTHEAEEFYLGPGWELIPGGRGAVRIPVGPVTLRPSLALGSSLRTLSELDEYDWRNDQGAPVRHMSGLRGAVGAELLVPASAATWLRVGVEGSWTTLDKRPQLALGFGVGASLSASAARSAAPALPAP